MWIEPGLSQLGEPDVSTKPEAQKTSHYNHSAQYLAHHTLITTEYIIKPLLCKYPRITYHNIMKVSSMFTVLMDKGAPNLFPCLSDGVTEEITFKNRGADG